MTQAESAEITMMLAAAYSSWRPPVETLRLYAAVLEPLPAEVAREATMRIIRSDREFAPPCGAIWSEAVKFIQETGGRPALRQKMPGPRYTTASNTSEAIEVRPGLIRAIEAAVKALGWSEICT